jgi:hypothetical protein
VNAPWALQNGYAIEDQPEDLPTLRRIDWVNFNRAAPRFRERAMRKVELTYG